MKPEVFITNDVGADGLRYRGKKLCVRDPNCKVLRARSEDLDGAR